MFRLEAVLGLDGSARHQPAEISLHSQDSLVLAFLGVKVISLPSRILCFLSIELGLVELRATTCLSHFLVRLSLESLVARAIMNEFY